jgi:SAM-dependent methyltransferase
MNLRARFDAVADEYDVARPRHPAGVYEALGPLNGLDVLDVGAGTGIASRDLLARGASVTAVDAGPGVLARAKSHTPALRAVAADGARLPIRSSSSDLVCFAQSWHWLDPATRVAESLRVLRPGGRWAGWWSHARVDGEPWFEAYWAAIEASCAGTHRGQRDTDWGATLTDSGFNVGDLIVVAWTRPLTTDGWLADQQTHSYVVGLHPNQREQLVANLEDILSKAFPDGHMSLRYETWMWIAES